MKAGETIVWVNQDLLAHTATAKGGAFDSKVIQPGNSWRFVPKTPGSFPCTCAFHPMKGSLTVR